MTLFGSSQLNSRKQYHNVDAQNDNNNNEEEEEKRGRPIQGTLSNFLFGFMYEDESEDLITEDDRLYSAMVEPSANIWNALNLSLCFSIATTAAAESAPLTIVAAMGNRLLPLGTDVASFAPRIASAAVLGASLGKFVNGPIIDLVGARRTFVGSSVLLSLSLLLLAVAPNSTIAIVACFWIEFTSTVQWPCILVTLAAHYRGSQNGMYEGGIFVTSLGSRVGALIGIPAYSLILQYSHWRLVALFGGWLALLSCSINYLYSRDSPERIHDPQNPIDPLQWQKWLAESERLNGPHCVGGSIRKAWFISRHTLQNNVLPSVRHICGSPTFWLVAFAHSGASTVRSSERVLATYFYDTNQSLTEEQSAGLAVYLSIGITAGLVVAGNAFASRAERERKWLVSRLYLVSILACYVLAVLAVPAINRTSPDLMRIFQIMAVVVVGFGIAVPLYHIPSIVGATFGCDKGIYAAYTDGVGYGLSSIVWGVIVGDSLRVHHGDGVGWAYGWAAVALLLIVSSILMVEFMEHYFCRSRSGGTYETIILHNE